MEVGIDGKSGLLVPVNTEASGPPTGVVPAGVPWPADPSIPTAEWHVGSSDSAGSSKWRAELSDESAVAGPSAGPSLAGPSPAGPSLAGPSPARPSLAGPSTVAGPSPVAEPSTVAGPSTMAEPLPARPSVTCAGPVTGAGTSTWSCRAGEEIIVIVLFSGGLTILGDNCTSRLATYKYLVLSALFRLLSWWLGGDLRSGDNRDEADDRDLRSPDDWWWRWWEEEAEGRVSDALETLLDCWHVSWSWTRPRSLDGTARPLAVRCHASTTGVWGSPVVCRPCVFSSGPHFLTYGGPTRESWAVPPQKPRTSVNRTQNSWLWSWSVSTWTTRRCWPAWKGVVASLQERGFRRNRPWPLVHWFSSPPSLQPRPCVASSEHWPWLEQTKPQADNLCTRDKNWLE